MKQLNNCLMCGEELLDRQDKNGEGYYCPNCDEYRYRNPKPVAGVLIAKGEKVLLIKRGNEPNKDTWSFPAGYVGFDESFREAAFRELEEETRIKANPNDGVVASTIHMEHKDHFIVGAIFAIEEEKTEGGPMPSDDAEDARFWSISELEENKKMLESQQVLESASKAISIISKD